jgi:hypothetical protein
MLNRIFISTVAVLLLSTTVFAQPDKFVKPDQKVVGAEEVVPAGEPIILKVTPITTPPKYLVQTTYSWKILADDKEKSNVLVWPDNTSVVFGKGTAKRLQAILSINYLYAVREKEGDNTSPIKEVGQQSSLLIVPIKLGNTPPPPPDNPDNPDEPKFPVGRFDLAKTAYKLAMANVEPTNRAKGAQAIATSTEGIAAAISAGTITNVETAFTQLKNSNNSALSREGISVDEWDKFGGVLQKELYKLYQDKKLVVLSDYADAFREMAEGLKKVK